MAVSVVVLYTGLAAFPASACGPEFPLSLTAGRDAALRATPHNTFLFEAENLLLLPPAARAPQAQCEARETYAACRFRHEAMELTPSQRDALAAMRQFGDGKEAYARGAGVPEAARRYAAGAVDFGMGRAEHAGVWFASIAELPEKEQWPRAVWSAFMLGRSEAERAFTAVSSQKRGQHLSAAAQSFARARTLAAAGAPDPLGLALASLGTEAQMRLRAVDACGADKKMRRISPRTYLKDGMVTETPFDRSVLEYRFAHGCEADFLRAIELYAEQAAYERNNRRNNRRNNWRDNQHGSGDDGKRIDDGAPSAESVSTALALPIGDKGGAFASLRLVAATTLDQPQLMEAIIADPLAQRLLVTYTLARVADESGERHGDHGSRPGNRSAGKNSGKGAGKDMGASPSQMLSSGQFPGQPFHDYGSENRLGDFVPPLLARDAAQGVPGIAVNPFIPRLLAAIEKRGIDSVAGADRLAALAYRAGDFDLAARLIEHEKSQTESALAFWVRAKLALHAGNLDRAAAAYSEAVRLSLRAEREEAAGSGEVPSVENGMNESAQGVRGENDFSAAALDPALCHRLRAEQSMVSLSRQQYGEAFSLLFGIAEERERRFREAAPHLTSDYDYGRADQYRRAYFSDLLYIAERVLSSDELKAFVDRHAPRGTVPLALPQFDAKEEGKNGGENSNKGDERDDDAGHETRNLFGEVRYQPLFAADRLRYLLARRLMREARYDEALPYFPAGNDMRYGGEQRIREHAHSYVLAQRRAHNGWIDAFRAEALFAVATITRRHGMEIMGYEGFPDYAIWGGNYRGAAGPVPSLQAVSGADRYTSEDEWLRYEAAWSGGAKTRFHYRNIAVQTALDTADMLPPRSQAFGAVLCVAHGWATQLRDPAEAENWSRAIYRRYLNQGAAAAWTYEAPAGGTASCTPPDFSSVRNAFWKQELKQNAPYLLGAVLAGLLFWLLRRRRKA